VRGASGPIQLLGKAITAYTPVTDQLLRNPPPDEWLTWRRTLDGRGYSPLSQISRENVSGLRMAWAWSMAEGGVEMTPLFHDGVLFLTNPGNIIQALDAKTGSIIWEYRRVFPSGTGRRTGAMRNIAMYQDKIFMTTSDAAIVALDARTGKLVWETQKADPKKGFTHGAGPIIANGVVVSGILGCARFTKDGCFITGHDPDTGRELWRTSTIALPGDPNNASWGSMPPGLRGGTDMWMPGSYDPQLNLFYIGTSQAKPWVAASRGLTASDAALYSNSTLALDPKTGKIVWYFQHVPAESLDLDTVFERVLIDDGDQKLLFTVGKDGLLWKMNRQTGAFLGIRETVFQNVFDHIDTKTGKLRYRADILEAKIGDWVPACPGYYGGHNWIAMAYSPQTNALIVPLNQHCLEMRGRKIELVEGSGSSTGGDIRFFEMPGAEGNFGRLSAFDVRTLEQRWTYEQRASFTTSALTTGGGLVFVGDVDRFFKAFDVKTGKILWQTRLGTSALGYPITYSLGGKQYVAVPTGAGSFGNIRRLLSPDIYAPSTGSALYVFELPDRP
jgi:alcohol dehydrogenase (cytochrome c)